MEILVLDHMALRTLEALTVTPLGVLEPLGHCLAVRSSSSRFQMGFVV